MRPNRCFKGGHRLFYGLPSLVILFGLYEIIQNFIRRDDCVSGKAANSKKEPSDGLSQSSLLFIRDNNNFMPKTSPGRPDNPTRLQNNVFYVWCGKEKLFEFHHYLSVLSSLSILRPSGINFYYDNLPVFDKEFYHTWFDELRNKYPYFHLRKASTQICEADGKQKLSFVFSQLNNEHGGIYVHENTILTSPVPNFAENEQIDVVDALDKSTVRGFMWTSTGNQRNTTLSSRNVRKITCTPLTLIADTLYNSLEMCLIVEKTFFPEDIWYRTDQFGRLTRQLFYGNSEIPVPRWSSDELVPNIAHMVWIRGGKMDFLFYLCVLSLLHIVKVDVIYIHGDSPPSGEYWDIIKNDTRIQLVYRELPTTVYGNVVEITSHISDIWRAEFMINYGGIYVDTDVIFVKPLDRKLFGYDAVGTVDWPKYGPFPDAINFGVAIGKRNAPYWRLFQESAKIFRDDDWAFNGLLQPYKVYERNPQLLAIDRRLQVICWHSKCHPTWWPDYNNVTNHHENSKIALDWQNDTYAFHWTWPTPSELKDMASLNRSDTMFARIGKHVLIAAGLM